MGVHWLYFLFCVSLAYGLHIPISKRYTNTTIDTSFTYEPIKTGYVSFGDSYAAGIGAGPTGSGGCRIGTNSYPSQLHTWIDSLQPGIDYQNLPRSGAVITEVLQGGDKSQIDKWNSPSKADRATLSIGGNDIGFYNVLTSCVLRVEIFRAGDCDRFVQEAYDIMNGQEFQNNVDNALRQMIAKSGRSEFKVVQTGYPRFFNDKTSSCDCKLFD